MFWLMFVKAAAPYCVAVTLTALYVAVLDRIYRKDLYRGDRD